MSIKSNIKLVNDSLQKGCRLIAVSKTKPNEQLLEAYEAGQRLFGENKVQELEAKYQSLPKDIEWHMIGHLQSNKVKYIAPFVALIHSVDSVKLLEEINKQGKKINRVIPCLLQVYIAKEETKFGLNEEEVLDLVNHFPNHFTHVSIQGLMGMATLTDNQDQIRAEFKSLKNLFDQLSQQALPPSIIMKELSMGMSADYQLAMAEGSTLVRVGSTIFGERNYSPQ
ncbi:MAG: YggS family pyridoxal phosphate-dependent enzyme [Bacteroidetes bacterium]|nr:YggS family pyridoxal phosphate-dependent enzyme [Bacteroidota bacterium]